MEKQVARINGYVRAVADQTHPLQTRLSLILTDFEPNGNRQGIPRSEAENIIRSALHMPLKINFTGDAFAGHTGAFPIGPIIHVFEGTDNSRDVIYGEAVIWNEVYNDVASHLKSAFAEGIGTSWEIYFEDSQEDSNGIQWLHGCVFAGTCVVDTPAYGPNRTRILAIAEALHNRDDKQEVIHMPSDNDVRTEAESLDDTRNDIMDAQDLLFRMWEGLDQLFSTTFDIEAATVETDIGKIAAQFAERISKIADKVSTLKDKAGLAEQALSELNALKQEKVEAEAAQARANLLSERKNKLAAAGISEDTFKDREQMYLDMDATVFDVYVADLTVARSKTPATAESKDKAIIPEPLSTDKEFSIKDLAAALRGEYAR